MTNKEFAKKLGVAASTASRYRAGKALAGVEKLETFRKAFGLTHAEAQALHAAGAETFGSFLRTRIDTDAP